MAEREQAAEDGAGEPDGYALHGEAVERITAAGTLVEASRVLTELLKYAAPDVHRRTARVTRLVSELVRALELPQPWEFEVAARLSHIGCLALPPGTLEAVSRGERLSDEDDRLYASHPLIARDFLADVRRLEDAREMIGRQREPLPGEAACNADRVTLGAQLLRVAVDLEELVEKGCSPAEALRRLEGVPTEYDGRLLAAARAVVEAA
jgi:response regulator RpfG family c-di-GMP phosphodiesterase